MKIGFKQHEHVTLGMSTQYSLSNTFIGGFTRTETGRQQSQCLFQKNLGVFKKAVPYVL